MPIKTLDIEKLNKNTGNQYELISIMSKRSRQVAAQEKLELDEKLKYFEGFEDEDEFSFNEEQENISKEFEKFAHATQQAIDEMRRGEIYFRYPQDEE
jgi:DNA-directed RNA polymerase subunit K/omega